MADWVYEGLRQRLDQRLLQQLRERRQETRQWGRENGWRFTDWSLFSPGDLVAWVEAFPESVACSWLEGETGYFIDDQYCCTFGCDCGEMVLAIGTAGRDMQGHIPGYLRVNLVSGQHRVEQAVGCTRARLRALFDTFLQHYPDGIEMLRQRANFMGGILAPFLRDIVRPRKAPPRSQVKTGRNDQAGAQSPHRLR